VADASWSWGNIGYIATGAAGGFQDERNPSDTLIDTIYALKAGHRQNAAFVMNRKTQAEIRKFKDGDGNYLWQPPATAGQPASLMGFPMAEAEDMPDIARAALDRLRRFPRRLSRRRSHRACACCAIPIRPSPMCCSTPPSASAAGCRISRLSS
jgi:hypothetical protein